MFVIEWLIITISALLHPLDWVVTCLVMGDQNETIPIDLLTIFLPLSQKWILKPTIYNVDKQQGAFWFIFLLWIYRVVSCLFSHFPAWFLYFRVVVYICLFIFSGGGSLDERWFFSRRLCVQCWISPGWLPQDQCTLAGPWNRSRSAN